VSVCVKETLSNSELYTIPLGKPSGGLVAGLLQVQFLPPTLEDLLPHVSCECFVSLSEWSQIHSVWAGLQLHEE